MQTTFDQLKQTLISISYLTLPNPNDEFEIIMNVLEDAKTIDAMLIQNDHPIAYESIKLNSHQLNYSIHDKELCAIMHALER